jgi:hypothetical protein
MASLNIEKTRKALQSFDFKTLFIEELGWSNPSSGKAVNEIIKEISIIRKSIAELGGALVFEITTPKGEIPESKQRALIAKEIQKQHYENVLIFIDKDKKQSIWHWLKNQDKKIISREHFFFKDQPGDGFMAKIASLVFDISEFDKEGNIAIAEVASRIKNALDVEQVVKKFYREYQIEFVEFLKYIKGIDNDSDRRWYASVILNRLMFIYFLQKKFFLDDGNKNYLSDKLTFCKEKLGKDKFYNQFLDKLFFEGFAKEEKNRSKETIKLIGKIKYLNGGLFLHHKIEIKYRDKIKIQDIAFENLFNLFNRYSWTLNDAPGGLDNEMNPDVLGYIFEKYINQKAFGAYYTRTEITEYLCEQTVYKLILDEINDPEGIETFLEKIPSDKRKGVDVKARRFDSIAELLLNLDSSICKKLIFGKNAVLPNLSLLDPACGSGAFLVAAMKTLINVYSAILGKIEFLGDKKLISWKKEIEQSHASINYYIKKQIITNNLYGVDIMEEATEIAKLRLFLALVASAQTVEQLEPLPNIDFNILNGNSLIGMMRVDPNQFNKHISPVISKGNKGKEIVKSTLFQPGLIQGNIFSESHSKSYQQLINEKEAAISSYKNAYELRITDIETLRKSIDEIEVKANEILDNLLVEEFTNLGIKYEQATWDKSKKKEGKPIKRNITLKDIEDLEPFHWGYEFSEIFRKKDGFDAIITNPPWEVLQASEKEFFYQYDNTIKKKTLQIEDWKIRMDRLMEDREINRAWCDYLSKFSYQSNYYKKSEQYKKALSGKLNLFSLFTLQTFNLLKKNGYCGIVIPSGIYSDFSTTDLRKMLFEHTEITGLFCFENKKEIFENVHRSFKFVLLSFEKGGITKKFPVAFMKHDISDLELFPKQIGAEMSIDLIKKLSPEQLTVSEINNARELSILQKLSEFKPLSEEWDIKLSSEFNMTTDSNLFHTTKTSGRLPLVEGKMFWQFQYPYSLPKYWLNEQDARKSLGEISKKVNLDYQNYRIGFRDVSANTNERCMVMTILPPNVFCPHTVTLEKINDYKEGYHSQKTNRERLVIVSICNSFVFDYLIRMKVTNHLSFFIVYGIPVPKLDSKNKWYNMIVERASKLICTSEEFADLWEDVIKTKWNQNNPTVQEYERNKLRAELDGIIAHVYNLTEEEFSFILSTFPIVPHSQKVAAQNAYRDFERGLLK